MILRIKERERKKQSGSKTRAFEVMHHGSICADMLHQKHHARNFRPIFTLFSGSKAAVSAFKANIQMGETATDDREREIYEWMKSSNMVFQPVATLDGMQTIALYDRDYLGVRPTLLDTTVAYCVVTPRWYLDQHIHETSRYQDDIEQFHALYRQHKPSDGFKSLDCSVFSDHDRRENFVLAAHVMSYLDKRTTIPIIRHPVYWLYVYYELVRRKCAILPRREGIRAKTPWDEWRSDYHPQHALAVWMHGELETAGIAHVSVVRLASHSANAMIAETTKQFLAWGFKTHG